MTDLIDFLSTPTHFLLPYTHVVYLNFRQRAKALKTFSPALIARVGVGSLKVMGSNPVDY